MTKRVVVVGGGITGLTVAFSLVEDFGRNGTDAQVLLIESAARPGGHAHTIAEEGFIVESGPNAWLNRDPEVMDIVSRLGLGERVVEANAAARRRFIVRGGRLLQVPTSPISLITSPSLSFRGKLRLMREPWASAPPAGADETIFDFAERRLGREVAETFVDPAISGISGGDSRALSLRSMFPVLHAWEETHGSLLKAAFAQPKRPGGRPKLVTFDRGLGVMTSALAERLRLGHRVMTGVSVERVAPHADEWTVSLADGRSLNADHVVMATPAHVSARLLEPTLPRLSEALGSIPYAGLAVVALAFHRRSMTHALDGYGYLVPRSEGLATLGVLWESSIFPDRAPRDHVLVRVMLGGASHPPVAELNDEQLVELALRDLRTVMGATGAPEKQWVFRWPRAIAQYTVGHSERLRLIDAVVRDTPGLSVCGTAFRGVSFSSAILDALRTAQAIGSSWSR